MSAVNIASLQRAAEVYQKDIKMLPYHVLAPVLGEHGINLYPGVENEDVIVSFLRKRGVARPYGIGADLVHSEIGKMIEKRLKVELAYASVKDNIQNYKEKTVITPGEMLGTNKTKKHPLELQIIQAKVTTFAEDVLDALFNAERNTDDLTPMGLFDGFETKVLSAISDGEISAAEGNIEDSDEFVAPADGEDTDAYDNLRDWVRKADPFLLRDAILIMPLEVSRYAMDALKNKTAQKAATFIDFQEYLNDDCSSNIKIVKSRFVGTGDRLYLTAPGNMDFGMNSLGDETFVEVNRLHEDRNIVNFWLQASFGTRWRAHHKKVFYTNTGSLTANLMSGDYIS
jgi:hypothetical protein